MRVTLNSAISTYLLNLNELRSNQERAQQELTTGLKVTSPTDDPRLINEIKRLKSTIGRNEEYSKNLYNALTDTEVIEDTLANFADTLNQARNIMYDAANPTHGDKLSTLGENIRLVLEDMVKIANSEYDGRYTFSGTLTTRSSIQPTGVETNQLPFELVEDPDAVGDYNANGLSIRYKGNFEARNVTTSSTTNERVNTIPSDAFGTGATEVFEQLIDAYNLVTYNADGSVRSQTDNLTDTETETLHGLISDVSGSMDTVNSEIGRLGGVVVRMSTLVEQVNFENTKLRELLSLREDADVVESAMDLKKSETALNAALQTGASVIPQSLLDFIR